LRDDKTPVISAGEETLEFGIKWMHMGSAYGEAIPLILVVACDELKEDEYEAYQIPRMSHSCVPGAFGYLVFCKTRVGGPSFFRWFLTEIVVPTVSDSRKQHLTVVCIFIYLFIVIYFNIYMFYNI